MPSNETTNHDELVNFNTMSLIEYATKITIQMLEGKYLHCTEWLDLMHPDKPQDFSIEMKQVLTHCAERATNKLTEENHSKANALTFLGLISQIGGLCGEPDYEQAISYFEQAIRLNNPLAMSRRAHMFKKGQGCKVDEENAILLYTRAIELGNVSAMGGLAHLYKSKEIHIEKALSLLKQAIQLKDVYAMYVFGMHYHQIGDRTEARLLIKEAAEKGYVHAMYQHGVFNYQENRTISLYYFEKAIPFGSITEARGNTDIIYSQYAQEHQFSKINFDLLMDLMLPDLLLNKLPSRNTVHYLKENNSILLNKLKELPEENIVELAKTNNPNHAIVKILGNKSSELTHHIKEALQRLNEKLYRVHHCFSKPNGVELPKSIILTIGQYISNCSPRLTFFSPEIPVHVLPEITKETPSEACAFS